jgi:hypothetical protein
MDLLKGYIENDIVTPSFKNLIKLNPDLTVDQTFNVGTGFNQILFRFLYNRTT